LWVQEAEAAIICVDLAPKGPNKINAGLRTIGKRLSRQYKGNKPVVEQQQSSSGFLKAFLIRQISSLEVLAQLFRTHELSVLRYCTLGSYVVRETHSRDVTERLLRERVCSIDDFNWTSQLRFSIV
jgi:hypothetical protein